MTKKLLAVDDDRVNLQIIAEIFEDSEHQLLFASDGRQALQLLENHDVDVVILDRMMPELDGMEVLSRIKATPRLARLPVIMQTAAAAPEQVVEGLRAGAHYYLTKPYSPEALELIVRAALVGFGGEVEAPAGAAPSVTTLRFAQSATFSIRTLDDAAELAALLSVICPDPATARSGLLELLVNAVEHGNLGITYKEKAQLKRTDRWREEVDARLQLADFGARRVAVTMARAEGELQFTIADEGAGFDWRSYLELDPARVFDPNGRGIALAKALSFRTLEYQGRGNVVKASIALPD